MVYHTVIKVQKDGDTWALIFGGMYNDEGIIYTINLKTMKADKIGGDVTYQRYGHSNSSINNYVYLFGGSWRGKCHNDLQKFAIEDDALETVQTSGVSPSSRFDHGSSVIGNICYVFGGKDSLYNFCNDLYSFNPMTH